MGLPSLVQGIGWAARHSGVPLDFVTGTGAEPRPRLRVDPSQTGFWEGRMFRVFHEFNIAQGGTLFGRFICPGNVIVHKRSITVVQGNLRFALSAGGTPSGEWTPKGIVPLNGMDNRPTPLYLPATDASVGGAVTGQTEVDVQLLETGGTQAVTVASLADESGLGAGTYYVEIRNTGSSALRGVYQVVWEEVQPRSPAIY